MLPVIFVDGEGIVHDRDYEDGNDRESEEIRAYRMPSSQPNTLRRKIHMVFDAGATGPSDTHSPSLATRSHATDNA